MRIPTLGRPGRLTALAASATVVTTAGVVLASDHQDTPENQPPPPSDRAPVVLQLHAFPQLVNEVLTRVSARSPSSVILVGGRRSREFA